MGARHPVDSLSYPTMPTSVLAARSGECQKCSSLTSAESRAALASVVRLVCESGLIHFKSARLLSLNKREQFNGQVFCK